MLSRHNGTHTLHFPFPLSIFLLLTARVIYGEISISGLFLSWLFPFTCTRHHFFRPFSTHFPTYPFVESVAFPLSFAPLLDTGKLRSHPSLLSYFERNSSAFELRRKYTTVFLNIARMSYEPFCRVLSRILCEQNNVMWQLAVRTLPLVYHSIFVIFETYELFVRVSNE